MIRIVTMFVIGDTLFHTLRVIQSVIYLPTKLHRVRFRSPQSVTFKSEDEKNLHIQLLMFY